MVTTTSLAAAMTASAAAPVAIKDVKVQEKTSSLASTKGNRYLTIHFSTQVNETVPKLMVVRVIGACKVGDKSVEGEISAAGAGLDKVAKGETKDVSVPLFMKEGLPGRPDSCDFTFKYGKFAARTGERVGEFCWAGGSVKEGACAK